MLLIIELLIGLRAEAFGLRLEGSVTPDWPAIQARKETIV